MFLLNPMTRTVHKVHRTHVGTGNFLHALEGSRALVGAPVAGSANKHGRLIDGPAGVQLHLFHADAAAAHALHKTGEGTYHFLCKLKYCIGRNVLKGRHTSAATLQTELERRILTLRNRETLLEEAFVFERRVDAATYERQRDKLREELALARIELEDARLEEIDVEGLLGFAEHVLANAARLWTEASAEQKQRLQSVLFPEGLRLRDGRFGTALTCLAFTQLAEIQTRESGMASLSIPSWNQILGWLRQMDSLRKASGQAA